MNEQTMNKLNDMKLNVMAEAYEEQVSKRNFQQMAFDERFSLLVDLEYLAPEK
ncbi:MULTISPECIES: ATP-binding protein [unclassified Planococcus (in: firmicutes)]|uniref:ATP-binding protein n=1 Tax=unclassified Planococcus (in: firmicutes) TaxID=2662419 RepID=UPI001C6105C8|nr:MULTISPECIES: ATP-binding protein [unclassified Planococcus (in: firmicutes)]